MAAAYRKAQSEPKSAMEYVFAIADVHGRPRAYGRLGAESQFGSFQEMMNYLGYTCFFDIDGCDAVFAPSASASELISKGVN